MQPRVSVVAHAVTTPDARTQCKGQLVPADSDQAPPVDEQMRAATEKLRGLLVGPTSDDPIVESSTESSDDEPREKPDDPDDNPDVVTLP